MLDKLGHFKHSKFVFEAKLRGSINSSHQNNHWPKFSSTFESHSQFTGQKSTEYNLHDRNLTRYRKRSIRSRSLI